MCKGSDSGAVGTARPSDDRQTPGEVGANWKTALVGWARAFAPSQANMIAPAATKIVTSDSESGLFYRCSLHTVQSLEHGSQLLQPVTRNSGFWPLHALLQALTTDKRLVTQVLVQQYAAMRVARSDVIVFRHSRQVALPAHEHCVALSLLEACPALELDVFAPLASIRSYTVRARASVPSPRSSLVAFALTLFLAFPLSPSLVLS